MQLHKYFFRAESPSSFQWTILPPQNVRLQHLICAKYWTYNKTIVLPLCHFTLLLNKKHDPCCKLNDYLKQWKQRWSKIWKRKEWKYRPRRCKIRLTKRRFKAQTKMNSAKAEVKSTLVVLLLSCVQLLWPRRQRSLTGYRTWHSPGKNTGAGCHLLLQGKSTLERINSRISETEEPITDLEDSGGNHCHRTE